MHVSELADERVEDPSVLVKLGETKKFRVIAIEPEAHKLSLSLKSQTEGKKSKLQDVAEGKPKKAKKTKEEA